MKYVKLGLAIFAVLAFTGGLALLTTGWIIAGSANTKKAEMNYHELVYNQALNAADITYSDSASDADVVYNEWYAEWLAVNPEPATADVSSHLAWMAQLTTDKAPEVIKKDAAVAAAAKVRDNNKTDAVNAYNRAVLNIKRNFKGDDNGQTFTGTYRAVNVLTTVKSTENGNADWESTTFETVLSPAGALLVSGMILTFIGGALGTCMIFSYLGVWDKIIENSKKPKAPKEAKPAPEPKKEAKEVKEPKEQKASKPVEVEAPPAPVEESPVAAAPAEVPAPALVEEPKAAEQPAAPAAEWRRYVSSADGQQG